ncbi:MAG: CHAT domain-containing protein [Planctomycetota bacterium]|nr:CHAT domain-containing protein [Planctomycetota bacterium]
MRILLSLLLLMLCAVGSALADERKKRPASWNERVLAAAKSGDRDLLRRYAERDSPDPWLVADWLALRDEHEAARKFASAAPRPDTARLPAYLDLRRTRTANLGLRAAVRQAEQAKCKATAQAALTRLDRFVHQGDAFERTLVQLNRGNLLSVLRRAPEAVEAWLDAAREAERLGWLTTAAEAYYVAGITSHGEMQYDSVMQAWNGLLLVEQGRGNEDGVARATMFIGGGHLEIGNFTKALRVLEESRRLYAAIGNDDGMAWALNNIALAHARRGEFHKEQAALERALELARRVGNEYRIACVQVDLGTVREHFGDHEAAEELYHKALAWFASQDDTAGVAQCQGNLGHLQLRRKDYVGAARWSEQALANARKAKDTVFICASLNALGWALMHMGELDRARELEEEAVALARRTRDAWNEAHALQSLADVLVRSNQPADAKRALDESLRVAAQLDSAELQMLGHKGHANLWFQQKDYARAVYASQQALAFSLRQLGGLPERQSAKARIRLAELYAVALRSAAALGKPQALFTTLESTRAGGLLEALENRESIRAARVPEDLLEDERVARNASHLAVRRYRRALAGKDWRAIRKARSAVTRSRDVLDRAIERIQAEAKSTAEMFYPEPPAMEDAQRLLAASDAFVVYSLLGDEALALVVTRGDSRIVRLGDPQRVRDAATASFDDPDRDPKVAMGRLRELLVEPLKLSKKTKRLLVSPDGILGYVPFSLLAGKRQVAYVPSAAAYGVLCEERTHRGDGVLALGDPDYKWKTVRPEAIAQRGGMRLVPLPATREEARLVGDVVLLDKEATPTRFLETVGTRKRWAAVHLACHGLIDPERPMRSALGLAFESDGSNLLVCADIFQRRIPADLAVLSACETGKGTIMSGEGIVGLTRAFMLAGAPRVLVSLWKVDDQATQALMVEFYKRWRPKKGRGVGAAEALRLAQAHVRSKPKWKHPYYWGAWVLWGLPD